MDPDSIRGFNTQFESDWMKWHQTLNQRLKSMNRLLAVCGQKSRFVKRSINRALVSQSQSGPMSCKYWKYNIKCWTSTVLLNNQNFGRGASWRRSEDVQRPNMSRNVLHVPTEDKHSCWLNSEKSCFQIKHVPSSVRRSKLGKAAAEGDQSHRNTAESSGGRHLFCSLPLFNILESFSSAGRNQDHTHTHTHSIYIYISCI